MDNRPKAEGLLKEKERLDTLQRNGYVIIQNPEKFCFGMDAVLLSGFAKAGKGSRVLDLGTGTGIIPILMEAKTKALHLTGLEIQEESADMARRSVQLNGLTGKIDIVTGDIKEAGRLFPAASFDVITCNPPYMIGQHGLTNPEHYTSVYDIYLIYNTALKYDIFQDIISRKNYYAEYTRSDGSEGAVTWESTNHYFTNEAEAPDDVVIYGGKTGTTDDAGACLSLLSKDLYGNPYLSSIYTYFTNL